MENHNAIENRKVLNKVDEYDSQTVKSVDGIGKLLNQKDDDISGNVWGKKAKRAKPKTEEI